MMSKCYKCHSTIKTPTSFCLNCDTKNAIASGIFNGISRIDVIFIGMQDNETFSLKKYDDTSLTTYFDLIAEKLYDRRIEEIYLGGANDELIEEVSYHLKNSLSPFKIYLTNVFGKDEFFKIIDKHVRIKKSLKKVNIKVEKKIYGSHSTIIGGREGLKLIYKLASSEYIKKVVPGVIENKGTVSGGVRLKVTRSDEKGNVRALLINGATVQKLHVITTASNKEEGEEILKILKSLI
ncbi:metal-binding protein [Archaeoglobales archaeon]|nr:MAG: metal-binding protein [Archaeoglobales archaeon]